MVFNLYPVCPPMLRRQNPIEDIWLNVKTWVRKFGNRLSSFALVKWFFNFTIQSQSFDFLKLHKFGIFEPTLNGTAFRGRQAPLNPYRRKFSHDRREQKIFGLLTK